MKYEPQRKRSIYLSIYLYKVESFLINDFQMLMPMSFLAEAVQDREG